MIAYLNKAGTLPVLSDVFRIAVMIGSSSGMHCFSNQVGMGSSAQKELDADSIVVCISSEVANLRQSSFPSVNGAMSRQELESNVKFTLNLQIFSTLFYNNFYNFYNFYNNFFITIIILYKLTVEL